MKKHTKTLALYASYSLLFSAGIDNLVGTNYLPTFKTEARAEIDRQYLAFQDRVATRFGYVRPPAPRVTDPDIALNNTAQGKGLSFCMLRAFAKQESDLNPNAVSNQDAFGLMQIQPETAARHCKGDLKNHGKGVLDCLADVQCNSDCGGSIIKDHLMATNYDLPRTAQRYFNGSDCNGPKCPKTSIYWRSIGRRIATDPSC